MIFWIAMGHLEFTRRVNAPTSLVWNVVTDHDLYGEVAPNLVSVEVIDGTNDTMVRRCVDTDGNTWTEACTVWEDGHRFAVEVDVATSGFHRRLFDRFEGEWQVTDVPDGTEVSIRFDYDTKYGPFGWLISAVLRYKAPGIVDTIFDRWEAELASRLESNDSSEARDRGAVTGAEPNAA